MRLARLVAAVLGLPLALVAVWMLAAPSGWFHGFPGVVASGPFNAHLVRDLAMAFLVASVGLIWAARHGSRGRPAVLTACALLIGHAVIHFVETLTHAAGHSVAIDAATVYVPGILAGLCLLLWRRGAVESA